MDKEELQVLLKNVISSFIKDDPDQAKTDFHKALSAKLQDRISPKESEVEIEDPVTDPEA
jgi:hypothetical protein